MTKKPKTKVDELRDSLKKKRDAEEMSDRVEEKTGMKHSGGKWRVREGKADVAADDVLGKQIRAAEEDAKNHYDKLLRVMAEFENFKRRMTKEREELVRFGNEKLLSDLLPSLDDLDRVLDHVPPDASDDVKKIAEGIELVRKTLLATLDRYDLKEVPALGETFDPSMHEAIATVESEAHEPDTVMAVHRKGYWLADRLLRPAMVTVAKTSD